MKILILGISGMLGSTLFRLLSENDELEVFGTLRSDNYLQFFKDELKGNIHLHVDAMNQELVAGVIKTVRPDVIINCIGLIKQISVDATQMLQVNSIFPRKLMKMSEENKSRLIHISTDCVFSGGKGNYIEQDTADADDIYGMSKYLGEVTGENCITIRTSLIGHELGSSHSLLDWFLSQENQCYGYTKAIFSGFPTIVFSSILANIVIPSSINDGLYHIAANPISKYELLQLISKIYKKQIDIIPSDEVIIDRSLCADKFNGITDFIPPEWPEMIEMMYKSK